MHTGRLRGGTLLVARQDLTVDGAVTTVERAGSVTTVASHAEPSGLVPRVTLRRSGDRRLPTALLLPTGHEPGTRLPVLMDPYGGPHAQRVVAARNAHLTSQWFADQGFAVVVVDGRGTPGLGPEFERAVHGDLAAPVLEDQVDALHAVAAEHPDLDLSRVGIRGWSFGGFLAALAVLRRPDVFHAAVAGAPVTDWALYDTHYTERYLGRPDTDPEAYARSSLSAMPTEARAPAAARARPRRRQRRGGAHPAVVLGPARRRTTAQRAAAVGGDAHDAAGGRRGEPLAAAGAVPQGGAGLSGACGASTASGHAASGMCSGGPHGESPRRLPARHSATATPSATRIDATATPRVIAAACG